jgi:hypothetical protein
MRFFEALDLINVKSDYKIYGFDRHGIDVKIWDGNNLEEAEKIAQQNKDKYTRIKITYKGRELQYYKVYGIDHLGNEKEIWGGNDLEEAKKIAWDAKNRFYDTTIKYKGKEIPKAGRLVPKAPYNY